MPDISGDSKALPLQEMWQENFTLKRLAGITRPGLSGSSMAVVINPRQDASTPDERPAGSSGALIPRKIPQSSQELLAEKFGLKISETQDTDLDTAHGRFEKGTPWKAVQMINEVGQEQGSNRENPGTDIVSIRHPPNELVQLTTGMNTIEVPLNLMLASTYGHAEDFHETNKRQVRVLETCCNQKSPLLAAGESEDTAWRRRDSVRTCFALVRIEGPLIEVNRQNTYRPFDRHLPETGWICATDTGLGFILAQTRRKAECKENLGRQTGGEASLGQQLHISNKVLPTYRGTPQFPGTYRRSLEANGELWNFRLDRRKARTALAIQGDFTAFHDVRTAGAGAPSANKDQPAQPPRNHPTNQNVHELTRENREKCRGVHSLTRLQRLDTSSHSEERCTEPAAHRDASGSCPDGKGRASESATATRNKYATRRNRLEATRPSPQDALMRVWNTRNRTNTAPSTTKTGEWRLETNNSPNREWWMNAKYRHPTNNSGTEGIWIGDERLLNNSALELNAEIAAAQSKRNLFRPKPVWRILEDTRYETGPTRLRCNEAEHRHKPIATNEPRDEIKGHRESGDRFQYPNNDNRNLDQPKFTNEQILTMTNFPLSSKPAERAPGKRFTPSSRGRFTHHPPHLIPNSRPLPSTLHVPPDPRPSPSAASNVRICVPTPCRVLGRRRAGELGPVEYFPREPSAEKRMMAVAQGQTARYFQGLALTARPGMLSSPQTVYTGEEHRPGGQEIHHAVLLNVKMLIHDSRTGLPAERTGHAEVRLFATPDDSSRWNLEVPFPSDEDLAAALVRYEPLQRSEVSAHQQEGKYVLTMDRTLAKVDSRATDNQAPNPTPDAAVPWRRTILPIPKAALRRIAAAAAAAKAAEASHTEPSQYRDEPMADVARNGTGPEPMDTDAAPASGAAGVSKAHTLRFLLRPVTQPPEESTNGLVRLGNAADGGDDVFAVHAVPRNGGPRYDTPHPPLRLYDSPPALEPVTNEATTNSDGGGAMEGVERTSSPRPEPAAAPAVTMPVRGKSNHKLERLNYNLRKCFAGAPAATHPSAFVFGAFVSPAPSPAYSTTATVGSPPHSNGMEEEEDVKSPLIPPARPSTAATEDNEHDNVNALRLHALELDTPRPSLLALAKPDNGQVAPAKPATDTCKTTSRSSPEAQSVAHQL
ncbi:hypothetical protein C8R47DRAFT_1066550 [Mycena vitilis]|nr:hypothetical protein C8R47DRAFT_1066550 [Mycena vitilis]